MTAREERERANARPMPDDPEPVGNPRKASYIGQPGEGIDTSRPVIIHRKRTPVDWESEPEKRPINPVKEPEKGPGDSPDDPDKKPIKKGRKEPESDKRKSANSPEKSTDSKIPHNIFLRSSADVKRFINSTLNQLRRGQVDESKARTIGYLCRLMLDCIQQSDFEKRLEEIEKQLPNKGNL